VRRREGQLLVVHIKEHIKVLLLHVCQSLPRAHNHAAWQREPQSGFNEHRGTCPSSSGSGSLILPAPHDKFFYQNK